MVGIVVVKAVILDKVLVDVSIKSQVLGGVLGVHSCMMFSCA